MRRWQRRWQQHWRMQRASMGISSQQAASPSWLAKRVRAGTDVCRAPCPATCQHQHPLFPLQMDVYTPLAEQLGKLWQLWEMVLTCQPLLVVAPSPGDASGCVAALMSLVAPLPYAADFRCAVCDAVCCCMLLLAAVLRWVVTAYLGPYLGPSSTAAACLSPAMQGSHLILHSPPPPPRPRPLHQPPPSDHRTPHPRPRRPYYTLHDPAFRHLQAGELPTPSATSLPCLMGVTNLFFIKALQQWPNILAVGHKEAAGGHWGTAAGGGIVAGAASLLSPAGAVKALKRRQQGALTLVSEHTQALWSSYRPLCRPDQGLLSRCARSPAAALLCCP